MHSSLEPGYRAAIQASLPAVVDLRVCLSDTDSVVPCTLMDALVMWLWQLKLDKDRPWAWRGGGETGREGGETG